ncbi:MAG: hypothetical protein PHQ05_07530 [Sterolibacterium sp.]|nr:hypothetical protein [Sterolibacterium sp.]
MTTEHKVLGALAVVAGVFFWFNLNALAYLVGAGMSAYACRGVLKSED